MLQGFEKFKKIEVDESIQVDPNICYCPKTYSGKYKALKNYRFFMDLRNSGMKWVDAAAITMKECNASEITLRKQFVWAKAYYEELEKKKKQ